jgi:hypothetical protein
MRILPVAFMAAIGLTFAAATASAAPLQYPADAPLFSVEFPADWKTEIDEDDDIKSQPADSSLIFTITELDEVSNATAAAKDFLQGLESTGAFGNLKAGDAGEFSLNGIKFAGLDATATDKDGAERKVTLIVFSPDEDSYFCIFCYATPEAEKLHDKNLASILSSIKKTAPAQDSPESSEAKPPVDPAQ